MVGYKSQDYLSWFQTLENIKTVLNIIQGWCAHTGTKNTTIMFLVFGMQL
jgi:hypothetical protein